MEIVFDEIFKALGYLFIAGIVYFAWKTAYDAAKKEGLKQALWKGFLWCGGLALLAVIFLGRPTCEDSSDPVFGGCDSYADNGYEPTVNERFAKLAYFITLFYVPVVLGSYKGDKERTL